MVERLGKVRDARIGSGFAWVATGLVILLVGGALAAGGGGVAAFGIAAGLAGGCFACGFWASLFHALEARLIDIETRLAGPTAQDEPRKAA